MKISNRSRPLSCGFKIRAIACIQIHVKIPETTINPTLIPSKIKPPKPLVESFDKNAIPAAAIAGTKAKAATTPTKVSVFCLIRAIAPEMPAATAAITLYHPGFTLSSSSSLLIRLVSGGIT